MLILSFRIKAVFVGDSDLLQHSIEYTVELIHLVKNTIKLLLGHKAFSLLLLLKVFNVLCYLFNLKAHFVHFKVHDEKFPWNVRLLVNNLRVSAFLGCWCWGLHFFDLIWFNNRL